MATLHGQTNTAGVSPRPQYDVLIVGAGHAGAQTAIALRQNGFSGSIALLGDEPVPPHERPLPKEYLSGKKRFERILIRPAAFWPERDIDLLLSRRVTHVDAKGAKAQLHDGSVIGYTALVWAAGGSPRRLTCRGHDLRGVHHVRSRNDVDRLVVELATADRIAVIGAGHIGLEAAAVLTELGKHVTVIEAQDRILGRAAGEPLSRFFEAEHRSRGVDMCLGATVERIEGHDGAATGVLLADGKRVSAEIIIVGIGIEPAVAPLLEAGAAADNGVEVDDQGRTSLPGIFAVGDCASHRNRFAARYRLRLESVQNANDQAIVVAKVITGLDARYDAVPWFWSNQYDLRLQTAGIAADFDDYVVRGEPSTRSFSVAYLRNSLVVAVDCVNMPKDFVQAKALVGAQVIANTNALADAGLQLRSFVKERMPIC